MSSPSYAGLRRCFSVMLICAGITTQAHAGDTLVPGAPKAGTVTYTVTLSNGTVVKVPVTITTEKTKGEKAETIASTMQGAPYNLSASVTAAENVSIGGATSITSNNATGEGDTFLAIGGPGFGSFNYAGFLTDTAFGGSGPVEYFAQFGFDGTTITSDILYSQLTTPTIDNLMTETYDNLLSQLAPSLDSDLSLNLSTDTITLDFLPADTNISVEAFSSDPGITVTQTLTQTPEPPGYLLLGSALVAIAGIRFSKSSCSVRSHPVG
jgi:hypothetical protein